MTTPAINRNIVGTEMATVITSSDTLPPSTTNIGLHNVSWDAEVRPSSSNGGRIYGFLLCKPWTHTGRNWSASGGSCQSVVNSGTHLKRVWPGVSFWGTGNNLSPPNPSMPSLNLINSVEVKALNKLKSQDVHLGNLLAEGRKTIKMVMGTATTIARQIERFRRSSPSGWKRVQQYQQGNLPPSKWNCIPSAWLQLQYGWNPLMSDILGSMIHLYRRSRFELPFVTVKQNGGSEDLITSTCSGQAYSAICVSNWLQKQRVYITLVYGVNSPQLAEISSLGLINPLEIVWELVPYSFVIDWFLPIGGWLSAMTADVGYVFMNGTKSLVTELHYKGVKQISYSAPGTSVSLSPPGYTGKAKEFARSCYGGSPVPGLYVKNPLSNLHIANAIALIGQAMGR